MSKKIEYRKLVLGNTIPITDIDDNRIVPFRRLSDSIGRAKFHLKVNTVDFIIIKILNINKQVYPSHKKQSFDVYVIGTFRKYFNPTYKVSIAFADFYLEVGILPNIIAVPHHILMKNTKEFANKFRNGVLIYERR